jgi:hypothetical protein
MQSLTFHSIKRGNIVMDKFDKKIRKVMREYKAGKLKSSSGDKVTSKDQAVAIAMSEAGMSKKEKK